VFASRSQSDFIATTLLREIGSELNRILELPDAASHARKLIGYPQGADYERLAQPFRDAGAGYGQRSAQLIQQRIAHLVDLLHQNYGPSWERCTGDGELLVALLARPQMEAIWAAQKAIIWRTYPSPHRDRPPATTMLPPETNEAEVRYPQEFSPPARARVEAERVRARKHLEKQRRQVPWSNWGPSKADEVNLRKYILRVFRVFGEEGCKLGRQSVWTVERVRSEGEQFLRSFTIEAHSQDGHDKTGRKLRDMTSHWDGSLMPSVQREFRKSLQWRRFEEALLVLAQKAAKQPRITAQTMPEQTQARPVSRPNKKSRKMTRARDSMALLWKQNKNASYKEIIGRADKAQIEVPWEDHVTWETAWEKSEPAVKALLCKAKKSSQS
jgi:hypothetical protein